MVLKMMNGEKYRKKVQKVAKNALGTMQKVAKILTIYLFYDNNIINGGDNDETKNKNKRA